MQIDKIKNFNYKRNIEIISHSNDMQLMYSPKIQLQSSKYSISFCFHVEVKWLPVALQELYFSTLLSFCENEKLIIN